MRTFLLVSTAIALTIVRPSAEARRWPGVGIDDVNISSIIVWGLEGASSWLKKPECRALFAEFRDQSGRPLRERLDALRVDEANYLRFVTFRDGSSHPACRRELTLMFTAPGSRVVFVCADQLRLNAQRDQTLKSALVLHEAMHTLGLGENPPSSAHITNRVVAQCAR